MTKIDILDIKSNGKNIPNANLIKMIANIPSLIIICNSDKIKQAPIDIKLTVLNWNLSINWYCKGVNNLPIKNEVIKNTKINQSNIYYISIKLFTNQNIH